MNPLSFVLPLTLLPGVALLIVSTAARFGQLHDEIHRLLAGGLHDDKPLAAQAHHFQRALLGLYLCVSLLAIAALAGVALSVLGLPPEGGIAIFTVAGCLCLLFAASHLVRESFITLSSIQTHLRQIDGAKDEPHG